jgi:hypothetical protein
LSILQDLLALKQAIPENQDEWEAMHAAQSDEYHSTPSVRDMKNSMVADIDSHGDTYREASTEELASADEFAVEHDSDDIVHLLDGEHSIRVTMPYQIWLELCQETVRKHLIKQARKGR